MILSSNFSNNSNSINNFSDGIFNEDSSYARVTSSFEGTWQWVSWWQGKTMNGLRSDKNKGIKINLVWIQVLFFEVHSWLGLIRRAQILLCRLKGGVKKLFFYFTKKMRPTPLPLFWPPQFFLIRIFLTRPRPPPPFSANMVKKLPIFI